MNYAEAVQYLYGLRLFGAKFGLENSFRLAELSGNPQNQLRFIHVAGTNGKGSTCAMLESIYRAAGLRVGLFTSPHLVSFRERIQVNREFISEADVVRLVQESQPLVKTFAEDHHPTFFEAVTIMALRYFAEQKCDLVIWETGLGGRLDATNIVTPLASIITNIGIEHSELLGDTVEKIAAEKSGIIKRGKPVITTAEKWGALRVIERIARDQDAPLTIVSQTDARKLTDAFALPLHGAYQHMNAAAAIASVYALHHEIPVSNENIRRGLATVSWPGRMQCVRTPRGQTILLDGAHNPDGADALHSALESEFPNAKPAIIFGVFRDKDSTSMCHSLAPLAGRIVLTPVHSDRSENPEKLVEACRASNPHVLIEVCKSLGDALEKTAREPFVVVAGSLYLVGEAMELLHLSSAPSDDEKALNEWNVKQSARR